MKRFYVFIQVLSANITHFLVISTNFQSLLVQVKQKKLKGFLNT